MNLLIFTSRKALFRTSLISTILGAVSIFMLWFDVDAQKKKNEIEYLKFQLQGAPSNFVKISRYAPRRKFVEGHFTRMELDTLENDFINWANWMDSTTIYVDSCLAIGKEIDTVIFKSIPKVIASIPSEIPEIQSEYCNAIRKYNEEVSIIRFKENAFNKSLYIRQSYYILFLLALVLSLVLNLYVLVVKYLKGNKMESKPIQKGQENVISHLETSYYLGHFAISLEQHLWDAYKNPQKCSNQNKSEYLHEYTHYLQDTATFYGHIYREQIWLKNIDEDVKGGNADDLFLPLFGEYRIEELNGRPVYYESDNSSPIILGSLALKESMAQEAQRYVFGNNSTRNSQSVLYCGIKRVIDEFLPYADNFPVLRFCIEDCCLMTEDPSKSLLLLLKFLQNNNLDKRLSSLTETDQIDEIYNTCEVFFNNAGLSCYGSLSVDSFDNDAVKQYAVESITGILYQTEKDLNDDIDRFCEIAEKINESRVKNLSCRLSNHTVIAHTLYDFKQTKDMKTMYNVFGMPVIFTEIDGKRLTNKDDF